ncbi:hypothetical protein SK803_12340 [Lentzea sp. BCCO 10_0856]|uniref:Uncharacterized protein n=1 Tax=Lentzea miocenica TaxID=3095431 RepID=A0ABU4SYL6_9PSEU|nr:hypothetical protein [Lentzea sp. BCCO 10_0856]MDX8031009.1 hypothetical protein [Lentzea sp. BCCO 10_0856]
MAVSIATVMAIVAGIAASGIIPGGALVSTAMACIMVIVVAALLRRSTE